jgi:hypothetical protein
VPHVLSGLFPFFDSLTGGGKGVVNSDGLWPEVALRGGCGSWFAMLISFLLSKLMALLALPCFSPFGLATSEAIRILWVLQHMNNSLVLWMGDVIGRGGWRTLGNNENIKNSQTSKIPFHSVLSYHTIPIPFHSTLQN